MKAAHQELVEIFEAHLAPCAQTSQPKKEVDLQTRLNTFFYGCVFGTANSELVVQSNKQPAKTLYNHHDHLQLVPDLAINRQGQTHVMGRTAIVELKPGGKALTPMHVAQLRKYVTGLFDENPFRKVAYGMLTNGKAFQLFKFSAVENQHNLTMERLSKVDDDAISASPTAADCMVWLLSQSADELGCVDWPTFELNGKNHTVGRILGFGESCSAYPAVPVDERIRGSGLPSGSEKESAVVIKVYHSPRRAAREINIYAAVPSNLQHTTKMLNPQPAFSHPENMVAVTPFAESFRARGDDENQENNREITSANVQQLIETLSGLHEAGIAHCDIQAKNIFCSCKSPYDAVLNDFGRSLLRTKKTFCEFRFLAEHDWNDDQCCVSTPRRPRCLEHCFHWDRHSTETMTFIR